MEFLKTTLSSFSAFLWAFLLLGFQAHADGPTLLNGMNASANTSAGVGNIYDAGGSLQIHLGDTDDPSNRTGEVHGQFDDQIQPVNLTDPGGALKSVQSWTGGANITLKRKLTLGVDLDNVSDISEQLYIDGVKPILGLEPFKLSYRYSRTLLRAPFSVTGAGGKTTSFNGAFIYQQTPELEYALDIGESDAFTFSVNYSFFTPPADSFAQLLNAAGITNLGNLQSELQSFELWSLSAEWRHEWTDDWDSVVSAQISNLIIEQSSLVGTTIALGYRLNKFWRIQVGEEYSHDRLNTSNTATLEFDYSWERASEEEE